MTSKQKGKLLKAQQGELDGVIIYRKLAEIVKDKDIKDKFLKIAADEGKHAAILKAYTGEVLKPKSIKAKIVITIYKALGNNFTLNLLANGELKAAKNYNELAQDFPNIQKIIKDEKKHAEIARGFISK